MFCLASITVVIHWAAVIVAALAGAAAVAVTADATADRATESTYLTFWLASFVSARSTGFICCRAIASSVTSPSWPHLTVFASDAAPVGGVTSGYSMPG